MVSLVLSKGTLSFSNAIGLLPLPFFFEEKEMIDYSGQEKYKHHRFRTLTAGKVQVSILTTWETKVDSWAKHFALAGEAV